MFINQSDLFNSISSIYKIVIFFYGISKCLKEERRKDVIKWITSFFIYLFIVILLEQILHSYSMVIVYAHSLSFFLVCGIVYRKKMYEAMVAYSIGYYIFIIYTIAQDLLLGSYSYFLLTTFISLVIFMIIYFYSSKGIVEVYNNIKEEKRYTDFIIVFSFIGDLFIMFNQVSLQNQVRKLEIRVSYFLLILLVTNISYYVYREIKIKKIMQLNIKLNDINKELRSIKECHGKVISKIYDLYKEDKNDEIALLLKSIINNANDNNEEKVIKKDRKKTNSIFNVALLDAVNDGIIVNIDERYMLENACIDKMELFRIISNIINNARRVVKVNGIINAKSYKDGNTIIIVIENNGPKIEAKIIDKIFRAGFTTKNNKDKSHGYGLNIVKELVEKNRGSIYVESTELITRFTIILPCI